jgi:hypothetical protein
VNFREQLEAIGSALLLIQRLPDGSVWSLTCTNDDDAESPTVLNVYAEWSTWATLIVALGLGKSIDRSTQEVGEQFVSFKQGTLLISFIEQEENR